MTIAYVAASLVMAKQRPPLKQFLVPEGPKRRKSWQELKAAIMLALGPGQSTSVSVPSSSGAESAGGDPSGGNTRSKQ